MSEAREPTDTAASPPLIVWASLSLLVLGLWSVLAPLKFIDLVPTYLAGQLWLAGELDAIYHPAIWLHAGAHPAWTAAAERLLGAGVETSFVYHPFYLLLNLPFIAALPLPAFSLLHLALNAVSTVVIARESLAWRGVVDLRWLYAATLGVALLYPTLHAAELGQNAPMGLALFLGSVRSFDASRPVRGSLLALLALAFKPWFLLLFGVFPFMGWFRRVAAVIGSYVVVFRILPELVLPAVVTGGYRAVEQRLLELSIVAFNNVSVRSLVHRVVEPQWMDALLSWQPRDVPGPVFLGELLLLALLGGASLYLLYRRRGDPRVLVAGMLLALLPLGILWSHYLIVGVPALVFALAGGRSGARTLAIAAGAALLIPTQTIVYSGMLDRSPLLALALIELPPLLLFATAFALLLESPSSSRA